MTFNSNETPHLQSNAREIEIPNAPKDTVSCLRFTSSICPQSYLMAGSWDKSVRIWQILPQGKVILQKDKLFQSPVLDCCWSQDCTKAFIALADKTGIMWDIISDQVTQVAAHDAPIKTINHIEAPNYSCLMTGGWDKKLKFWDMNSVDPILSFDLSDKIHCADVHFPVAVVATADNKVALLDLRDKPTLCKQIRTKLRSQIRCIRILVDSDGSGVPFGFVVGGLKGCVAVHYFPTEQHRGEGGNHDDLYSRKNYTFKYPQQQYNSESNSVMQHELSPINEIVRHPRHMSIGTMGTDGKLYYWDIHNRKPLKQIDRLADSQSISAGAIDAHGSMLAYAFGYDWSKGHHYRDANAHPRLFLRECDDDFRVVMNK